MSDQVMVRRAGGETSDDRSDGTDTRRDSPFRARRPQAAIRSGCKCGTRWLDPRHDVRLVALRVDRVRAADLARRECSWEPTRTRTSSACTRRHRTSRGGASARAIVWSGADVRSGAHQKSDDDPRLAGSLNG
jgi:hypothetical protein